jgi:hypothetical protein
MNYRNLCFLLGLALLAVGLISACNLASPQTSVQTEDTLATAELSTPSIVPVEITQTPRPSPISTSTPTPVPTHTKAKRPLLTTSVMPTARPQDFLDLRESFIGKHGEKDHLIFHIIVRDSQAIPSSFQILDLETGQATDPFILSVSPIPNLCALEETVGWKYYKTDKIFFEDLPLDYWERLWRSSFNYLIKIKQTTGQEESIILTEPPASCVDIVE